MEHHGVAKQIGDRIFDGGLDAAIGSLPLPTAKSRSQVLNHQGDSLSIGRTISHSFSHHPCAAIALGAP
jgi:hypothetical protein